jgi:hypothetical protein
MGVFEVVSDCVFWKMNNRMDVAENKAAYDEKVG